MLSFLILIAPLQFPLEAHLPITQIFLQLERGHVCVDVLVLHYIFLRNTLSNLIHALLLSWRLQLSNSVNSNYPYEIMEYHQQ